MIELKVEIDFARGPEECIRVTTNPPREKLMALVLEAERGHLGDDQQAAKDTCLFLAVIEKACVDPQWAYDVMVEQTKEHFKEGSSTNQGPEDIELGLSLFGRN